MRPGVTQSGLPKPWANEAQRADFERALRRHLELAEKSVRLIERELNSAVDAGSYTAHECHEVVSALDIVIRIHRQALKDLHDHAHRVPA